jgi:hypothetical protein
MHIHRYTRRQQLIATLTVLHISPKTTNHHHHNRQEQDLNDIGVGDGVQCLRSPSHSQLQSSVSNMVKDARAMPPQIAASDKTTNITAQTVFVVLLFAAISWYRYTEYVEKSQIIILQTPERILRYSSQIKK